MTYVIEASLSWQASLDSVRGWVDPRRVICLRWRSVHPNWRERNQQTKHYSKI